MWILAFKSLKIELQSVQPQRLGIEQGNGVEGGKDLLKKVKYNI